jgi:DNA-binding CsgD family transcriptional regulator
MQGQDAEYSPVRDDVMAQVGRQIKQLSAEGLSVSEIEGRLDPDLTQAERELARLTARHVDRMGQSANGVGQSADGAV